MRLHTKICDTFGAEFPIFAFTHCKDVAAAVTNAGGVGVSLLTSSPAAVNAGDQSGGCGGSGW